MPTRRSNRPDDEQQGLNDRQAAFVGHYLTNFNATQAAIKAGYAPGSASVKGASLLAHVKVKAEIQRRKAELAHRSEISRDWLVRKLAEELEAAAQGTEHFDKDGNLKHVTRRPEAVSRLGELLARMHGWIEDKPGNTNQTLVNFVIQR